MEIRENGMRYKNYGDWSKSKQTPYDYDKNGLIKHILSPRIVNTNNYITKTMLYFYEKSIIYVLKYIDKLKHFKDVYWSNR